MNRIKLHALLTCHMSVPVLTKAVLSTRPKARGGLLLLWVGKFLKVQAQLACKNFEFYHYYFFGRAGKLTHSTATSYLSLAPWAN